MRVRSRVALWLAVAGLIGVVTLLGWAPRFDLPDFRRSSVSPLVMENVVPTAFPPDSVVVLKGDVITYRVVGSNVKIVDNGYELLYYSDSTDGGVTWVSHVEPKIVRSIGLKLEVE